MVELNPKIIERIGRGIMVGNGGISGKVALIVIEFYADIVISAILPIARTRGASS